MKPPSEKNSENYFDILFTEYKGSVILICYMTFFIYILFCLDNETNIKPKYLHHKNKQIALVSELNKKTTEILQENCHS